MYRVTGKYSPTPFMIAFSKDIFSHYESYMPLYYIFHWCYNKNQIAKTRFIQLYIDVARGSWRLDSPANLLFVQQLVYANNKNIDPTYH